MKQKSPITHWFKPLLLSVGLHLLVAISMFAGKDPIVIFDPTKLSTNKELNSIDKVMLLQWGKGQNSHLIATGCSDKAHNELDPTILVIWNALTKKPICEYKADDTEGEIRDISWSPNGQFLAVTFCFSYVHQKRCQLLILNLTKLEWFFSSIQNDFAKTLSNNKPQRLFWSSDSTYLFWSERLSHLYQINLINLQQEDPVTVYNLTFKTKKATIHACFTPEYKNRMIVIHGNRNYIILDLKKNETYFYRNPDKKKCSQIAFHPDGTFIYKINGILKDTITIRNTNTKATTLDGTNHHAICFCPIDSRFIAYKAFYPKDKQIYFYIKDWFSNQIVWSTEKESHHFQHDNTNNIGEKILNFSWSSDGSQVAITDYEGRLIIFDVSIIFTVNIFTVNNRYNTLRYREQEGKLPPPFYNESFTRRKPHKTTKRKSHKKRKITHTNNK